MFSTLKRCLTAGLLCSLCVVGLTVSAQESTSKKEFKTVATVAVASADSITSQLQSLGTALNEDLVAKAKEELAKNPEFEAVVKNGIDATKPTGLVVRISTDGFNKQIVGFLPTKDAGVLRKFAEETLQLEVRECEDGVLYTIGKENKTVYVKVIDGWLLFSDESNAFEAVGDDPAATLGGLDQQYAAAVQFQPCNVPFTVREMILLGFNQALQEAAKKCPEKSPEADAKKEQLIGLLVARVRTAFSDTESATFGVKFDCREGFQFQAIGTAVEGSAMANYFGQLAQTKNSLSLLVPDTAVVAGSIALPIDAQRTEIRRIVLDCVRTFVTRKLNEGEAEKIATKASEELGEEINADQVKTFIGQVFDATSGEIERAKCESGFAIVMAPGQPIVSEGAVACNGKAWEPILGQLWNAAVKVADRKMNDAQKAVLDPKTMLEANVAGEDGVSIHRISGPSRETIFADKEDQQDEEKAFETLIGDKPEVAITFAPFGIGAVAGPDSVGKTQKMFDVLKNMNGDGRAVLVEAFVSLRSLANYMASIPDQDNGQVIADAIGDEPGRAELTVTAEGRTVTTSVRIDNGFFRGIAAAAKSGVIVD